MIVKIVFIQWNKYNYLNFPQSYFDKHTSKLHAMSCQRHINLKKNEVKLNFFFPEF